MKHILLLLTALFILNSCATKKEILYFQDSDQYNNTVINYTKPTLQPNDILKINVGALVSETAIPYNVQALNTGYNTTLDYIKLQGYLVSTDGTIVFPVLGKLKVSDKTNKEVENEIQQMLEKGGHLKEPTVGIRLLNAKVTILGEVKNPGTYSFTEQNITLPQALGFAGDLTINGQRDDVLLITEDNGMRKVIHVDLTKADWFNSPHYFISPNDFIVVNPNNAKVKSAGLIGDVGIVLTIVSIALSTVILLVK